MRYVFNEYTFDTQQFELLRAGVPIALRPKVFHLLAYLLAQRARVVPRQELCEHLWPRQFISDATLDACLAQARQAVGDSGRTQRVLQTRHGYGYRFVAAVAVHDHPSDGGDGLGTSPLPHESAEMEPMPVRASTTGDPVLVREALRGPPVPHTPVRPPLQPALSGERKVVSVMVCMLADVATWAQRLEAEELHQRMQAFFALLLETVKRYGGTLQRVLDDGALVLFGAPLTHEDHAHRAVLAALGLQQGFRTGRADPAGSQEAWVVRMGLHTGQIVIGSLGDNGRLTFTPVGDTTQLAACLAQRAAPDTILVSDATARLVQGAVRLEAGPPVYNPAHLKPRTTYRVLGVGPRPPSLAMHGGHPRSPFVGRQLELATLQALLTRVEGGQGQVVSVVGEPGMGKTRLVHEFQQRLGPTRVACLEGGCDSYGQTTPYLPVQQILRQACGLVEADSAAVITGHVHHHLQELGMTPAEEAPYLLSLLGVPDAPAHLAGLSPQIIRARTFAALHQLLLRQSQRHPLLVVVENLHWSDPTSQAFLTELVERLAGLPLLLVVTCRPGYRPPWMDKSYATQITLSRLGPEDSQRVVQAVLPAAQLPEHLLRDILARAAGNPLFLEELAWAAREQGGWQLPPEIPVTVQAVLAARIDRLPHKAKHLLQTAAVIGLEVPWPVLQAVAEVSEEDLRRELLQLQAAEFLHETRLVPEGAYTFKHALTHEVAYSSLLQERRRALHARIMAVIEKLYADRLAEQVERLAHHAFQGEIWDKAVAYFRQAGDKALARSAFREAVTFFEQDLVALKHLPESHDAREKAIDLHLALHHALSPLEEYGRFFDHLREAEILAEALHDQRRLGLVLASMCSAFRVVHGDHDRAVECGQRALAIATALGEFDLKVVSNHFLGQTYRTLGDYHRAMHCLRMVAASLEGNPIHELFGLGGPVFVASLNYLVWCLADLGEFAEGIARAEEAVRIAEALDQPESLMLAYRGVGYLYLVKGDLHKAIAILERGLALCKAGDLPGYVPWIASSLGYAYVLSGRIAEAIPLLEQAVQRPTSTGKVGHAVRVAYLGEAYLVAGRVDEVMALALHALEFSREHKERGHEAWALRLLGEIAAGQAPPEIEQAESHYHHALALAEALGMRPLQAHCHLGLGKLYAQCGQGQKAHAELSTAAQLFRSREMTFWLLQAETLLTRAGSS